MAQAVPPVFAHSRAMCRHGNASRSGAWNVRSPHLSRSSGSSGLSARFGHVKAYRMGSFMSGVPSCAIIAPSRYSTSEWMMLWRWTTTSTCSTGSR